MKKLSQIIVRIYLRLRVKDANQLGIIDPTSGKVVW